MKLSIVDSFKKAWYSVQHKEDVYDPGDFDQLWKIDEHGQDHLSKPFLDRAIGVSRKNNFPQKENKEYTNVIEHPSLTPQSEVVVIEPRSFDEALEIVEELRCRRSVVLNLQYLDADQSQRVVDFLAGATHALDGHQQRIGQGVFIFAPNNFTINTESQESRALKDAFWGRRAEAEQVAQNQYSETVKKNSIF